MSGASTFRSSRSSHVPAVVVIGGGGTGCAILHDLALRGVPATLVERGELTSGTTGRHHGQLHSGARYAVGDREIARECMQEVRILQKIAPQSMEMNYGLFIALSDEDEAYGQQFTRACAEADIPVRKISRQEALGAEPLINPALRYAYVVPDGTLDAYRLPMQFAAAAMANGATIRRYCRVLSIDVEAGRVRAVRVVDRASGRDEVIPADIVINAGGAWAGQIAGLAGAELAVTPAFGTMVAVSGRHCNMVVSHLHPAGDGDILVPQRGVTTIGTTQWEGEDPDDYQVPQADIDFLLERAEQLMPGFSQKEIRAAWTAARPLAGRAEEGGRGLSRDFAVVDHGGQGAAGLYSVVGGKATVLRAMAEAAVDRVCADVDIQQPCRTRDVTLPDYRDFFRVGRPMEVPS